MYKEKIIDVVPPQKYNVGRPVVQEIPTDVVKKLFLEMDQDIDYRVSAEEINSYIR